MLFKIYIFMSHNNSVAANFLRHYTCVIPMFWPMIGPWEVPLVILDLPITDQKTSVTMCIE